MTAGQYVAGLGFFGGTMGANAIAASLLRRRYLSHLEGLVAFLAWVTLFFAALVLVHLVPGMLGVLTRAGALVAAAVLLSAAALLTSRSPHPSESGRVASELRSGQGRGSVSPAAMWPLSLSLALAVAVAAWAATLLWQRKTTLASLPFSFDMLSFDLPLIARWMQSQSIWVAHDLMPLSSHAAYPQNADVVYMAAILPWRNAFLAPVITYPIWALAALGVYAIADELGARPWAAILVAAVCAAVPLLLLTTVVDNLPDVFLWAMFTSGVLFLLRHLRRPVMSELVVAGLALGLAFGSKWYGLTCIPVVVVMWLIASWSTGRRSPLRVEAPVVVGLILAAGGFWLLRNLLEYGDPVFPRPVSVLGLTLFSSPPDRYGDAFGFTVAHYLGDWSTWRRFIIPEYRLALRLGGTLLVAGAPIALAVAAWRARRGRGGDRLPLLVAAAATATLIVYLVTPETALGPSGMPTLVGINARYGVPALLLAAAVIGWGLSLGIRGLWIPSLALGVAVLADSYRTPLTVSTARAALAALLIVGAGLAVARLRRRSSSGRSRRLPLVAALTGILLLGAAGSGYALQRRFNSEGLRGRDTVVDWVLTHARSDTRIGMTGTWSGDAPPVLAMFGPTFDNTVRYVGRIHRGFVEHFSSYRQWLAAVRAAHLDLLLVGRQPQPLESDVEAMWAARTRFPVVAASSRFVLYRPAGRAHGG